MSISILTATFNAAEHLPRLIESLRAQTDRDFEWIVMDGASEDGTVEILRAASDVVSVVRSEADFGIYHALNKAIALATSKYYLVLGSDDFIYENAISDYRNAIKVSGADIISGAVVINQKKIPPPFKAVWWRSTPLLVSAHSVGSLIRKDLHGELGFYSRRFPIAADTYFFLHAWRKGKKIYRFDEVVGVFGSDGVSGTDVLGGLCESFRANVEVRGYLFANSLLLLLRIIKNASRIGVELMRRRGRY